MEQDIRWQQRFVNSQAPIPGIPETRHSQLEFLFAAQPRLEAVWLLGSRALERHREGFDNDLCLEGVGLVPVNRLGLMAAVDVCYCPGRWRRP